jgi:type I restriction enzyme S subunit
VRALNSSLTLRDVCSLITKGTTPTRDQGGFLDSGIPYIKSECLNYDGFLNLNSATFISPKTHLTLKRSQLQEGDILYSIAGANLGKCCIVPASVPPANTNQAVAIIRVDTRLADLKFVGYFLRDQRFVRGVLAGVAQSAQPNVNLADIGRFELPRFSLSEQRAIGSILEALDDKIELNRKMSATLEAIAQALFKSWFIDFDPVRSRAEGRPTGLSADIAQLFTDSFQLVEDHEIPVGWTMTSVSKISVLHRTTINPMGFPTEVFEHFSIPAFDAGKAPISELGSDIKSNKFKVPAGAVLLSKLNPSIERVWLTDITNIGRPISSTEFLPFVASAPYSRVFLYCLARSAMFREQIASLVTGTSNSHQRVNIEAVLALRVAGPPARVLEAFDQCAEPILQRVFAGDRESRTLSKLRDALLPKLISGELQVIEAERLLKKTA